MEVEGLPFMSCACCVCQRAEAPPATHAQTLGKRGDGMENSKGRKR